MSYNIAIKFREVFIAQLVYVNIAPILKCRDGSCRILHRHAPEIKNITPKNSDPRVFDAAAEMVLTDSLFLD